MMPVVHSKSQLHGRCATHKIDDLPHFFIQQCQQRSDIGAITSVWPRWITFSMPQRDANIEFEPIELHIRCRTIEGVRNDFCAVFNFPVIDPNNGSAPSFDGWSCKTNVPRNDGRKSYSEQSVLVSVFQGIEDQKQWREIRVRSIVRLTLLDNCPHIRAESFDAKVGFSEFIGRIADGESEIALIGGGSCPDS